MATRQEKDLAPLGPWPAGINNLSREADTPEDALREALNVDIGREGKPRRRAGYTSLLSLTEAHSLHIHASKILLVDDGELKRLNFDLLTLASITAVQGELAYADVGTDTYFTDGVQLKRVNSVGTLLPQWTPNPVGAPTLTEVPLTGGLQAGTYQITLTNIGLSGEESGADIAEVITVAAGSAIVLSDVPTHADASYVRVYMTSANGEVFYAQQNILAGQDTLTLSNFRTGKALETQFAEQMPAGDLLCYHAGRLYVAVGNTVLYSEALRPGLTRIMDNYLPPFAEDIKVMLAHESGIYIVADSTYFLPGNNPEKMELVEVFPHSGVKGTGALVPASVFDVEATNVSPYWFSDVGPVLGLTGGQVVPLTEDKLAVNEFDAGASLFREEDGIRSMITAMQGSGEQTRLGTTTSVSFEVRRNGITLPP